MKLPQKGDLYYFGKHFVHQPTRPEIKHQLSVVIEAVTDDEVSFGWLNGPLAMWRDIAPPISWPIEEFNKCFAPLQPESFFFRIFSRVRRFFSTRLQRLFQKLERPPRS